MTPLYGWGVVTDTPTAHATRGLHRLFFPKLATTLKHGRWAWAVHLAKSQASWSRTACSWAWALRFDARAGPPAHARRACGMSHLTPARSIARRSARSVRAQTSHLKCVRKSTSKEYPRRRDGELVRAPSARSPLRSGPRLGCDRVALACCASLGCATGRHFS